MLGKKYPRGCTMAAGRDLSYKIRQYYYENLWFLRLTPNASRKEKNLLTVLLVVNRSQKLNYRQRSRPFLRVQIGFYRIARCHSSITSGRCVQISKHGNANNPVQLGLTLWMFYILHILRGVYRYNKCEVQLASEEWYSSAWSIVIALYLLIDLLIHCSFTDWSIGQSQRRNRLYSVVVGAWIISWSPCFVSPSFYGSKIASLYFIPHFGAVIPTKRGLRLQQLNGTTTQLKNITKHAFYYAHSNILKFNSVFHSQVNAIVVKYLL